MNFYHTLYKNADNTAFNRVIDYLSRMRNISKKKVLIDVDGSLCAIFSLGDTEFSINNDYDVDSIYATSDIKLPDVLLRKLGEIANNSPSVGKTLIFTDVSGTVKSLNAKQLISFDGIRAASRVARNPRRGKAILAKHNRVKKVCTDKHLVIDESSNKKLPCR